MKVSPYPRQDSPFVWLTWMDPARGKRCYQSSKIRRDDPHRDRKLAKKINGLEGRLLDTAPQTGDEAFGGWVASYLRQRHAGSPATFARYANAWNWLAAYLLHIHVATPRELTRGQVLGYLDWRCGEGFKKRVTGRITRRGTALYDLRVLRKILEEAIVRGYAERNVAAKLGVQGEPAKQKPELSDEEIALIRKKLRRAPDWMRVAWEIAINTGLRHAETRIDLINSVDLIGGTITIEDPKGGRQRAFTIPLPAALRPMFETLRPQRRMTWEHDRARGEKPISLQWRRFFDAAGLPHVCFHCTRTTFITRGLRAGVPENVMMKFVNHASREISRIYQRLTLGDTMRWAGQIPIPPDAGAIAASPRKKSSRKG